MKRLLIYFLSIFPVISAGQSSFAERNPDIFEYKDYVDQLNDTSLVVLSNEKFTSDNYDNGSELKGIFLNDKLLKISTFFGLSYGIITADYYIKEGKLVFAIEVFKGFKYDPKTNTFDYSEFDISAQGWYLFESDKMIDTESLGHWRFEDDMIDPEERLLSEFYDYQLLLNK